MSKVVLDEELEEELKNAKKKPRNFAIIAKGVNIKKVILSKKPIREGQVMGAKTEFKGDTIIRGICSGDGGQDIAFQVLEEPKIRPLTFKEFITEQTGLTLKPRFAVVKEIKEVDEVDPSQPTTTPTVTQTTGGDVDPALSELMEKMNKLAPMIKKALGMKPERRDEVAKLVTAFKSQTQEETKDIDGARQSMFALATIVKEIATGSGSTPPQPQVTTPQPKGTQPQGTQPQGTQPQTQTGSGGDTARQQKKDDTDLKGKQYNSAVKFYEAKLKTNADPKYRQALTKWQLDFAAVDQIADDNAAIRAYDQLGVAAAQAGPLIVNISKKEEALDTLTNQNTVPEYQGKNPLKSTGKKEFERDVTRPVAALMAKLKGPLSQGQPIPEAEHTELARLKVVLAKKEKEYEGQAGGVDKDKNPNTKKLYDDYASTCSKLRDGLESMEKNFVDPKVTEYREKKREAEAALAQLSKTVDLWKKFDLEVHKTQLEKADGERNAFKFVDDQFAQDKNPDKAVKEMGVVIADIRKAIKEAFASKESNDLLDGAVKKIGREAKSSADKEFVKEALKARYNIDRFEGDLTGTSLIALYKVFGSVPDSHTKNNEWLTVLKRDSDLSDVESYYSAPDKDKTDKPKGTVAIKAMRSAGILAAIQNNMMGPLLLKNVKGNKKVDQFSWVTLHEIGHAVDHADDFMKNRRKDFGDWQDHTPADIEAMMLTELAKEHPKLAKTFLKDYIDIVRKGKDPATDKALLTAYQKLPGMANQTPDWKALAASKIFVWYKNAVLVEPPGILAAIKQMTGTANWIRAAEAPIGGRVYHEAYEKKWVSYEPSIRATRVSDYQMRADGEYFAEAYAAFNLGKLPSTAPLYNDLAALKDKQELGT